MKWYEIRIQTTEEAYDAISEMLSSIGAGGVVIEDPNDILRQIEAPGSLDYADEEFMNSLGEDVVIKAYFSEESSSTELEQLIREKLNFISQFLDIGKGYTGYAEVDDQDWATGWKKYYKPFHISDRVVIKPSWEEYNAQPGELVIEMDPGMAFGTGTHETTRMCAGLLDKYVKPRNTVIDVGCGTGILSIIAAGLGASSVDAVDVDDVAVRVTMENSELNGVADRIRAQKGGLDVLERKEADIVVANIIADVIIGLAPAIPGYIKRDGLFITSGIIRERKAEVLAAYKDQGLECVEALEMGEWVAMVLKCQSSL